MIDFKNLRKICTWNVELVNHTVDGFLVQYAAGDKKLALEWKNRIGNYKHLTGEFQPGSFSLFKDQFLAHKIFKKYGLIKKYFNHSALKYLSPEKKDYLEYQADNPWRFCFSVITEVPEEDFFCMEDVFTGLPFLIYSPGIVDFKQAHNPILWFNLLRFNGSCWQGYGPIGAYNSFQPDDIAFFTTELNPYKEIMGGADILEDIEENPVPYMMLLSGGKYPLTFHKKDQVVLSISNIPVDYFNTAGLKQDFKVEYNANVYKCTPKQWGGHPHFASAYYDENKKEVLLSAMTDRGYSGLVKMLGKYGCNYQYESDIRINYSMLATTEKILNKKIMLNEYDSLFEIEQPEENMEEIDKLNNLLGRVMTEINNGRKPDIDNFAKKSGIDPETARSLIKQILQKFDDFDKPGNY